MIIRQQCEIVQNDFHYNDLMTSTTTFIGLELKATLDQPFHYRLEFCNLHAKHII